MKKKIPDITRGSIVESSVNSRNNLSVSHSFVLRCFERTMRALLILNFVWICSSLESKHPPGHLEPLGSHQPPLGSIDNTDLVPSSQDFFEQYALPGEPVLFKGAAKKMPAYSKWTDEYLR